MIRVYFQRDAKGSITAFHSEGHSGYAESGRDIVCAAISALLQAAVFSLEMLYHPSPIYAIAKGTLRCELPQYEEELQSPVQVILRHTLLGVMNIALSQPRYLDLHIEGVDDWRAAFHAENVREALADILTTQHIAE